MSRSADTGRTAPWFLMRPLPAAEERAWLPREEARHATGSRRLSTGDPLVLFDARGRLAHGRLGKERGKDGSCEIEVLRVEEVAPDSPAVAIATAVPKGDRWGTLLEMAAQIGASRIQPLQCERSVVPASSVRPDRAERILIEACKQARRAWCPVLAAAVTPIEAVGAACSSGGRVAIAHPGGRALRDWLGAESTTSEMANRAAPAGQDAAITILIGPEGGFADAELSRCVEAGADLVSLGASILRIETACVVALSLLREWSVPGSNR